MRDETDVHPITGETAKRLSAAAHLFNLSRQSVVARISSEEGVLSIDVLEVMTPTLEPVVGYSS